MTDIDTAALRAAAEDAEQAAYAVSVSLHPATVRALCDGYDEAQRLHALIPERIHPYRVERDAARQALADFAADLRALCADRGDFRLTEADATEVRAVIDRHAPEGGR